MATPLEKWVEEAARLTKPERIVWCDGSEAENQRIIGEMLKQGDSLQLNEKTYPNCYLHRSSPNDVARTEHLTFICARTKDDVGPTNNWMDPGAAKYKVGALLDGAMRGRTMYAVPYIMVPVVQLERIRALLDANKVRYWVDEEAISLDGKPEITVINLGGRSDPEPIQHLLDSIP